MLKSLLPVAASVAAIALAVPAAHAEGETKALKSPGWSWEGPFGTYKKADLQRGFQVYREVCSNCHSMKLVAFRHLGEKGGPFYLEKCPEELDVPESVDCSDPAQHPIVKSLAEEYTITDGPDEYGDMY